MEVKSLIINIKDGEYGRQLSTNIAPKDEDANWVNVVGDCFNHLEAGYSYKIVCNKDKIAYTTLEGDEKRKLYFDGYISAKKLKRKTEEEKKDNTPVDNDLPF